MGIRCFVILVVVTMAYSKHVIPYYHLEDAPQLFEIFKKTYHRVYKDAVDEAKHYAAFVEALAQINKYNSESDSATFGINNLTDFTPEEKRQLLGFHEGSKYPKHCHDCRYQKSL
ncbi:cysteine proteinase-like [Colias croceus]|uniref:cysteine proteinase-like n=1 Tax=Colias crocea TaxID=72248 RepID=UPI001E27DB8B|nr:cysteine proteinase-like [Colias croceus]